MKKILSILLLLPLFGFGQQVKIDTNTVSNIKIQQDLILSNLDSHHKQYLLGTAIQIGGALFGSLVLTNKTLNDDILAIPLAIASMAGVIIVIDSDKWFSKRKTKSNFSLRHKRADGQSFRKASDVNIPVISSSNTLETVNPSNKEFPDYIIFDNIKYSVGDDVVYTFNGKSAIIEEIIRYEYSRFFFKFKIKLKKNNKIKYASLDYIVRINL